ncbi:unnamed protein product, partial [Nesidiocoris tenuis]
MLNKQMKRAKRSVKMVKEVKTVKIVKNAKKVRMVKELKKRPKNVKAKKAKKAQMVNKQVKKVERSVKNTTKVKKVKMEEKDKIEKKDKMVKKEFNTVKYQGWKSRCGANSHSPERASGGVFFQPTLESGSPDKRCEQDRTSRRALRAMQQVAPPRPPTDAKRASSPTPAPVPMAGSVLDGSNIQKAFNSTRPAAILILKNRPDVADTMMKVSHALLTPNENSGPAGTDDQLRFDSFGGSNVLRNADQRQSGAIEDARFQNADQNFSDAIEGLDTFFRMPIGVIEIHMRDARLGGARPMWPLSGFGTRKLELLHPEFGPYSAYWKGKNIQGYGASFYFFPQFKPMGKIRSISTGGDACVIFGPRPVPGWGRARSTRNIRDQHASATGNGRIEIYRSSAAAFYPLIDEAANRGRSAKVVTINGVWRTSKGLLGLVTVCSNQYLKSHTRTSPRRCRATTTTTTTLNIRPRLDVRLRTRRSTDLIVTSNSRQNSATPFTKVRLVALDADIYQLNSNQTRRIADTQDVRQQIKAFSGEKEKWFRYTEDSAKPAIPTTSNQKLTHTWYFPAPNATNRTSTGGIVVFSFRGAMFTPKRDIIQTSGKIMPFIQIHQHRIREPAPAGKAAPGEVCRGANDPDAARLLMISDATPASETLQEDQRASDLMTSHIDSSRVWLQAPPRLQKEPGEYGVWRAWSTGHYLYAVGVDAPRSTKSRNRICCWESDAGNPVDSVSSGLRAWNPHWNPKMDKETHRTKNEGIALYQPVERFRRIYEHLQRSDTKNSGSKISIDSHPPWRTPVSNLTKQQSLTPYNREKPRLSPFP